MSKLFLYKRILRALEFYPSIKRDSLIVEVKGEFRRNRDVTDAKEQDALAQAEHGIKILEQYRQFHNDSQDSDDWTFKVGNY
jgi:Complex 1 protein (LYR family)